MSNKDGFVLSLDTQELSKVASTLLVEIEKQGHSNAAITAEIKRKATELLDAAHKVAASHSGSNFGYHGALYFRDFEVPAIGSMFSVEWGGIHGLPPGWEKREPDEVKRRIEQIASHTFESIEVAVKSPLLAAKKLQQEILIQLAPLHQLPDGNREKKVLEGLEQFDWKDSTHKDYALATVNSYPNITRDLGAASQGRMLASHDYYAAVATQVERSCEAIDEFWNLAERLLRQLQIAGSSKLVKQIGVPDDNALTAKYERLRGGVLLAAAVVSSALLAIIAEYAIRDWHWEWLLSHANSYSIRWLTYTAVLLLLIGLFVRRFRKYCWGFSLIPIVVGALQLLGGPPSKGH